MEKRVIYQLPTPKDSPLHNEPHLTTSKPIVSHPISNNSALSIKIRIISSFLRLLFISLAQFSHTLSPDSIPSQQKLELFIFSVLKRSKLDLNDTLIFTSVYYLLKAFETNKFSKASLKSLCVRRLWLLSLILSSKYHNEENYSFKVWSNITGLSITDLNSYEVLLLKTLNYDLFIDSAILVDLKEKLMSNNVPITSQDEGNFPISPPCSFSASSSTPKPSLPFSVSPASSASSPFSASSQPSSLQPIPSQSLSSQSLPSPSLSSPSLSPDSFTSPNQQNSPCLIVNVPATKVNLLARLLNKTKQAQIHGYVEIKNVHATDRKRYLDNDDGNNSDAMGIDNFKKIKY